MCDDAKLAEWARTGLTRRRFGGLSLAGAAAACAPMSSTDSAAPAALSEEKVSFPTGDGTLDGEFYHPATGKAPGVIFWPDIAGIRPAKRQMARRLAGAGYAVLLANPYYRDAAGQQFADFADFAGLGGFKKVSPWRGRFNADTIIGDQRAAAAWLLQQDAVDTARGVGTQGYCMTGSFALIGPAAAAEIRAGASFHGGGLVRDDASSPHRMFQAGDHYLIAIGQDDDAEAPGDKAALRSAADAAGAQAEIEVYPADHGWCVPDSPSYDAVQADRAWARLLALYERAL